MNNRREIEQSANYVIRLKGAFDEAWLAYWLEGFVITKQTVRETTLTGSVADEAALHGLLAKIGNLGLELLFLERIENSTK